jgi:hypothetical protein
MALTFKDFSNKQYTQIPEGELKNGDVFICRTTDYNDPFESWDYAVARMQEDRPEIYGKFKLPFFAKAFACAI